MSSMYGADVAQLRALAQQFDGAADRLDLSRMTVGNAIQISAWIGPVAVRFRAQWESDYSRKVSGAAARLREAALALRRNADDQDRTSAVDGGTGSASGLPSSLDPVHLGGSAITLLERLRELGVVSPTGPLGDLIKHIRSMEVIGIEPWQLIGMMAKIGELADVKVGWIGDINTAFDAVEIFESIRGGDPDFLQMTHVGADLLAKWRNPVAGLASIALHAGAYAGQQAGEADFSSGTLANNAAYIAENPLVIVEEVGKAVMTVGKEFVGWLPI